MIIPISLLLIFGIVDIGMLVINHDLTQRGDPGGPPYTLRFNRPIKPE